VLQTLQKFSLGCDNERELQTLASALRLLAQGKLCSRGDVQVQPFKAIEHRARTGSKTVASHIELTNPLGMSTLGHREQKIARVMQSRELKLAELSRKYGQKETGRDDSGGGPSLQS